MNAQSESEQDLKSTALHDQTFYLYGSPLFEISNSFLVADLYNDNRGDPDGMPLYAASLLGFHYLSMCQM